MTAFQAYAENPSAGQAGFIAAMSSGFLGDSLTRLTDAAVNSALGVTDGATPGKTCKVPTTEYEAKTLLGVLINPEYLNDFSNTTDYDAADPASILERGYIWVVPEENVVVGDPVCVRITSDGGSNTTLGKFRKTSDYPTAGIRLTPTAVNSQVYSIELFDGKVRETYQYTSDSTATVAEITAGLAAAINAGTAFDATDNTTTLDVTSVTGVLEIQPTSNLAKSNPARAVFLPGYRWESAASGGSVAKLRVPAKVR